METMPVEASFYHDRNTMKKTAVNSLKSNMSLDFTSQKTKQRKMAELLSSPDIGLLKLASPELERMIIQQGTMTTTPTPTTSILFPRSVTEEQEAYARGFVDALAELHKKEPGEEDGPVVELPPAPSATYTTLTTVSTSHNSAASLAAGSALPAMDSISRMAPMSTVAPSSQGLPLMSYTTMAPLPSAAHTGPATSNALPLAPLPQRELHVYNQPQRNMSPAMQYSPPPPTHPEVRLIKEEPQRVPSLSPQLTPIDMDNQECIKLERKRARNRVAARKCRTRKLERISRLEDRVSDLKGQNGTLVKSANDLREQVFALKQQILEHVSSGCKVMLSANLL